MVKDESTGFSSETCRVSLPCFWAYRGFVERALKMDERTCSMCREMTAISSPLTEMVSTSNGMSTFLTSLPSRNHCNMRWLGEPGSWTPSEALPLCTPIRIQLGGRRECAQY